MVGHNGLSVHAPRWVSPQLSHAINPVRQQQQQHQHHTQQQHPHQHQHQHQHANGPRPQHNRRRKAAAAAAAAASAAEASGYDLWAAAVMKQTAHQQEIVFAEVATVSCAESEASLMMETPPLSSASATPTVMPGSPQSHAPGSPRFDLGSSMHERHHQHHPYVSHYDAPSCLQGSGYSSFDGYYNAPLDAAGSNLHTNNNAPYYPHRHHQVQQQQQQQQQVNQQWATAAAAPAAATEAERPRTMMSMLRSKAVVEEEVEEEEEEAATEVAGRGRTLVRSRSVGSTTSSSAFSLGSASVRRSRSVATGSDDGEGCGAEVSALLGACGVRKVRTASAPPRRANDAGSEE